MNQKMMNNNLIQKKIKRKRNKIMNHKKMIKNLIQKKIKRKRNKINKKNQQKK
jgi:hypothetical protein